MPVNARDILSRVQIVLQDAGAVRWLLPELAKWASDGLREIANRKPSATSEIRVLPLVAGTKQTLPDDVLSLVRVVRNVTGTSPTFVGGITVTPVVREILDAQVPGWHDPTRVTQRAQVRHVIFDPLDPRTFYVYPGNTGTGQIECVVSAIPDDFTIAGGADPDDLESYNIDAPISAIYLTALVDFTLYRAFSKDMQLAGAGDRAAMHYQQFAQAIDTRTNLDTIYQPNTTNSQPNS